MGLGLTTCGEGEDVSSVHTLLSGIVQIYHKLHVVEEEEKEEKHGRQEEREVERGQSEEIAHMNDYVDGTKVQDSNLSQI